jgi:hypothetical protein
MQKRASKDKKIAKKSQEEVKIVTVEKAPIDPNLVETEETAATNGRAVTDVIVGIAVIIQRKSLVEVLLGTKETAIIPETEKETETDITKMIVVGKTTITVIDTLVGRINIMTMAEENGIDCSFNFKLNKF